MELDCIQIFVSDIQKAREWYSNVLGMKFIEEYPEIKCILMTLGKNRFYIETPTLKWGEGWKKVKIGGRTNQEPNRSKLRGMN